MSAALGIAGAALSLARMASRQGFALGPAQNEFASNAARDTYASANPTWLAQYDASVRLYILVTVGASTQLQVRRNNAWTDISGAVVAQAASWARVGNVDRIPQAKMFAGAIVDLSSITRVGPSIRFSWITAGGETQDDTLSAVTVIDAIEAVQAGQRLDLQYTQGSIDLSRITGLSAYDPDVDVSSTIEGRIFSPANIYTIRDEGILAFARAGSTDLIPLAKLSTTAQSRINNAFSAVSRMGTNLRFTRNDGSAVNLPASDIVALLSALTGTARLPASAVRDLPTGGGMPGAPTPQRSAAELRTLLGVATTAHIGFVPTLPTQNAARHFLGGDGAFDEIDYSDIQNRPTIPTLRSAAETRTLIGAVARTHAGLVPQLPSQNNYVLLSNGLWAQLDYSQLSGRPTIPTLRTAAQTLTLIGYPTLGTSTTMFVRGDGQLAVPSYTDLANRPTIPTLRTAEQTRTLLGLPAFTSGTTRFLREDGSFEAPPSGGAPSGGGGEQWPDVVSDPIGSDVQMPATGVDTYGAWTEVYRLTNSTSEEKKYQLKTTILCVASWWPGSDGADRAGAEMRVRRFNSSDVAQATLIPEFPVYVRTGSGGFDELSHYDLASLDVDFELQAGDYLLIDGRGISQKGGTGRTVNVSASLSSFRYLDVTDVGGGTAAAGTVSSNATLTGDGTSGSPLGVTNPFSAADEARLDQLTNAFIQAQARAAISIAGSLTGDGTSGSPFAVANPFTSADEQRLDTLTDTYLDERSRDAVGTALVEGDGIEIDVDDDANTITISADHQHSHTSTHTRRLGVSTDTTFVVADFTQTTTSDTGTLPTFSTNSYVGIAIPNDEDDLTFIRSEAGGLNQIGAFTKQVGTLTFGGVTYKWWRSNRRFLASNNSGTTIEFGS